MKEYPKLVAIRLVITAPIILLLFDFFAVVPITLLTNEIKISPININRDATKLPAVNRKTGGILPHQSCEYDSANN